MKKMIKTEQIETYFTHYNGDRPFKIIIRTPDKKDKNNKNIEIYKKIGFNSDSPEQRYEHKFIYDTIPILKFSNFKNTDIFIGKSTRNKLTQKSGGYGKKYKGNTILICVGELKYIYVCDKIIEFTSFSYIRYYDSSIGNNNIPYPYAVDKNNNYYLITEDVVIYNKNKVYDCFYEYLVDNNILDLLLIPYRYYYNLINIIKFNIENEYHIKSFMIGDEIYSFTYHPNPEKEYERLIRINNHSNNHGNNHTDKMIIEFTDGKKVELDKKTYIKIIKTYGKMNDFKPIKNKIIKHV